MSTRIHKDKIEWANAHSTRFVFQRVEAIRKYVYAVFTDTATGKDFATTFFISKKGVIWDSQKYNALKLEKDPPSLPLPKTRRDGGDGLFLGFEEKKAGLWRGGYYLSE